MEFSYSTMCWISNNHILEHFAQLLSLISHAVCRTGDWSDAVVIITTTTIVIGDLFLNIGFTWNYYSSIIRLFVTGSNLLMALPNH